VEIEPSLTYQGEGVGDLVKSIDTTLKTGGKYLLDAAGLQTVSEPKKANKTSALAAKLNIPMPMPGILKFVFYFFLVNHIC
jgi:hypothetical protein